MEKKKVLILGGGFGGVFAAKELARRGADRFDIELINNNNYFVFQPLLPEVAAATIHSSDAVAPLRLLLRGTDPPGRRHGHRFRQEDGAGCRAYAACPSTCLTTI